MTRRALAAALCAAAAMVAGCDGESPSEETRVNPIHVTGTAQELGGEATLTVSFTDRDASAELEGRRIALQPGALYRLRSCLRKHRLGRLPRTECASRTIDTRGQSRVRRHAPPPLSLVEPRPPEGSAAVTALVVVEQQERPGVYREVATSWPAEGVEEAGVSVPARGSSDAPALESEGVPLKSGREGGLNTGLPDSFCIPVRVPARASRPSGQSDTALGPLPAPYEVGLPGGGAATAGVMLLFHGGSWVTVGPGALETELGDASRWRARGWASVNASYRGCGHSLDDALAVYDAAARYWPGLPICTGGSSAGAWLALWVAASRPAVDCAVLQGPPLDPPTLRTSEDDGPRSVYNLMAAAFGAENLDPLAAKTRSTGAPLLIGIAERDPLIPWEQALEFHRRVRGRDTAPNVEIERLATGREPWVHAGVSPQALASFHAREEALVEGIAARR